jgi:hypothetical protein
MIEQSSSKYNLTDQQTSLVRRATDDAHVSLRFDYSGRGMYGRTCLGMVFDDISDFLQAIVYIDRDDPDLSERLISQCCLDSMGMSQIAYFPSTVWHTTA